MIRAVGAIIAIILALYSLRFTLAEFLTAQQDYAWASRLAPHDGRITALMAASQFDANADPAARHPSVELAKRALVQDAMAEPAASLLGIDAQANGDVGQAQRYFAYAERLSRRDLLVQLWAIQDAVARGDVVGALHHYDIALRVNVAAKDALYPVLDAASADPAIRKALVHTLAENPRWRDDFLDFVAVNSSNPLRAAELFEAATAFGVPIADRPKSHLVDLMVVRGFVERAWAYYATIRSPVDRRRSRDPNFTANLSTPTVFDWTVANADGSMSITRGRSGGIVGFTPPAGGRGVVLQQRQRLPPGDYRLSGHSPDGRSAAGDSYWTLRCEDGRDLGRVALAGGGAKGGEFVGRFTVPPNCPVQTLELVARPSEGLENFTEQVDHLELVPTS